MKNEVALVRYPQGLTADVLALKENYGEYASLIRDLIVYINKAREKDLFGFVKLDVANFANEMGYTTSYLRRSIGEVDNVKKSNAITLYDHTWDSMLEYSLFLMHRFTFSWRNSTKKGFRSYSLVLIEGLGVTYKNAKNAKRTYEIRLGSYVFETFFNEYYQINFDDYLKISTKIASPKNRNELLNLYLYLLRAYNIVKNKKETDKFFTTTVDEISDILQLKYTEGNHRDRKQKVKKALESLVLDELKFNFVFRKTSEKSRFSYSILIEFFEKNEPNIIEAKWATFALYYMNELKVKYYQLKEDRKVSYNEPTKQQFIEWFNEKETDTLDKIECIKIVINTIYKFEICFSLGQYFKDETLVTMYLKYTTKEFYNIIDTHLMKQKEVSFLGEKNKR